MKLSYDYGSLIKELEEEIEDGTLSETSDILVLRSASPISQKMDRTFVQIAEAEGEDADYRPIVDWYYDDLEAERMLAPDPLDSEMDIAEKKKARSDFERDRPFMKLAKVRDVLAEMREWSRVA